MFKYISEIPAKFGKPLSATITKVMNTSKIDNDDDNTKSNAEHMHESSRSNASKVAKNNTNDIPLGSIGIPANVYSGKNNMERVLCLPRPIKCPTSNGAIPKKRLADNAPMDNFENSEEPCYSSQIYGTDFW